MMHLVSPDDLAELFEDGLSEADLPLFEQRLLMIEEGLTEIAADQLTPAERAAVLEMLSRYAARFSQAMA